MPLRLLFMIGIIMLYNVPMNPKIVYWKFLEHHIQ